MRLLYVCSKRPLNVRKTRLLSVHKMRLLNVGKLRLLNVRKKPLLNVRKMRLLKVYVFFFKQRRRNFSRRTAHKFSQALIPKPALIGVICFIAWRKYLDLSFLGSVVAGCVYKNLQDILPRSQPKRNGTESTT